MAAVLGYSQASRSLKIDTPLGEDKLLLRALSGQESISQLFRFQLDLLSEDDSIKFESIVGKPVTLQLEIVDGERHFHGYVSRFSQGTRDDRFTSYKAEMVPWLWFLTRTADCRIFQNKTAPDIIRQIFKDLGFSDFKLQLYKSYRTRDYCVQYRETDFNFVSRLMEEEGIYYFFEHQPGKHTMILADDAAAHQPCPNQEKARCESATAGIAPDDVITEVRLEEEFRPSAWAHTDYNFETPSTSLMVTVEQKPTWEIYDYPGIYPKRADGDKLAKMRLEETTAFKRRATGKSHCRCFNTGFIVEITDHYRADLNQKWLLTAVYHQATMGGSYSSGSAEEGAHYANTFECIPASVPFRPPRLAPKPHVQGCQTAVVVGPPGEEIYTDKYGRVKVQFHWDREGKKNEDSSCWIRVSSPWAGRSWGGIQIPRIGQEVVVDFLEGDPDQPLIIGRVYHAESMPPWELPAKAVISGFKSDSTKGGGGYNEISLDDTKGNELIRVHAQFDQDIKVEHDERTNVGNNRTETVGVDETITIGNNRTETVGANENITIGANRTEQVGSNETISIGASRTETVGTSETITIGTSRTETVVASETITVGGSRTENVGKNETVTVSMLRTHNVGLNDMLNVGAAQEVSVGGAQAISVGLARAVTVGLTQQTSVGLNMGASVGKDMTVDAGKNIILAAGTSITFQTGASSITMKSDGTIVISGQDIRVEATGKIMNKAAGDVVIKGAKISAN